LPSTNSLAVVPSKVPATWCRRPFQIAPGATAAVMLGWLPGVVT
jgi:hypothetical protein